MNLSEFTIRNPRDINKLADMVQGVRRRPVPYIPELRVKNGGLNLVPDEGCPQRVHIESRDRPVRFDDEGVLHVPLLGGRELLVEWPKDPRPNSLKVAINHGVSAMATG